MSHNFTNKSKKTTLSLMSSFGTRQSRNSGTVYQESTSGIIVMWTSAYSAYIVIGPSVANINVAETHFEGGHGGAGHTAFLPKGWYWQASSGTCSWIPINS